MIVFYFSTKREDLDELRKFREMTNSACCWVSAIPGNSESIASGIRNAIASVLIDTFIARAFLRFLLRGIDWSAS